MFLKSPSQKQITPPPPELAVPLVTSIGIGALPAPEGGAAPPPQKIVLFVEPVAACQLDSLAQTVNKAVGDRFILLPSGRFVGQHITPGDSISPYVPSRYNVPRVTAGTFGPVVDASGKRHVLSCNHVVAYNGRVHGRTPIVDPGTLDDWNGFSVIASRTQFVKLKPAAWPVTQSQGPANMNTVDCALAELGPAGHGTLGPLPPGAPAAVPTTTDVHKNGRTTGLTQGTLGIFDWEGFIDLSFGTFYFRRLVGVLGKGPGPFAAPGDSGAAVIEDASGAPVGMVVARVYSSGTFVPGAPVPLGGPFQGYIVLMCSISEIAAELSKELTVTAGDIKFTS
jgi:hypothetical protein